MMACHETQDGLAPQQTCSSLVIYVNPDTPSEQSVQCLYGIVVHVNPDTPSEQGEQVQKANAYIRHALINTGYKPLMTGHV